jgi:hypothetical protein
LTYYVHFHDGHYHVLRKDPIIRFLDERVENPWIYFEKVVADNVAALLNAGVDPERIQAMDHYQICVAHDELLHRSGGVVLTEDVIAELVQEAERGYDPTQLRPRPRSTDT